MTLLMPPKFNMDNALKTTTSSMQSSPSMDNINTIEATVRALQSFSMDDNASVPSQARPVVDSRPPNMISLVSTEPLTPADIESHGSLYARLIVYIWDLRKCKHRPDCRERLDNIINETLYLGAPYFTVLEVVLLKSLVVDQCGGLTLGDELHRAIQAGCEKRQDMVDINGVPHHGDDCIAYDIATCLEKVFNISGHQLREGNINHLLRTSGLDPDAPYWVGRNMSERALANRTAQAARRSRLRAPYQRPRVPTLARAEALQIRNKRKRVDELMDEMSLGSSSK